MLQVCTENGDTSWKRTFRHYCFDFAEKVLLPKPLRQPGQLHFDNGLKIDLNALCALREQDRVEFYIWSRGGALTRGQVGERSDLHVSPRS